MQRTTKAGNVITIKRTGVKGITRRYVVTSPWGVVEDTWDRDWAIYRYRCCM